jgi:hypothetical protein
MAAATSIRSWRERRDADLTNDAIDLMRFWREHEAAIGIRSNFGSMLAALEGMAPGSGPPAGWDPLVDRVLEIGRCRRTWQVLREMDSQGLTLEIVALHRLYGDVLCPLEYRGAFGDVAALASLTDAAEGARDRLAYEVGTAREQAVVDGPLEGAVAENRAQLEREIARSVEAANKVVGRIDWHGRRIERCEAKAAHHPDEPADPKLPVHRARRADLTRRLAAWDAHIVHMQKAAECDGVLRARHGALAGADREVTVDDAIRHVLQKTRNDVAARSAFVVGVVQDAKALRARAHEAYKEAKRLHGWVGPTATAGAQPELHDETEKVDQSGARVRGSGWSTT